MIILGFARTAMVFAAIGSAREAQEPVPRRVQVDSLPHAAAQLPARPVRVCAGGDVTLGTNLDTTWASAMARRLHRPVAALPDPDSLLSPLRPLFARANIVLVNVEGAVGEGEASHKCGPLSTKCFALRQPLVAAAALRTLAESAEVVGNLANNHSHDAGEEGVSATVQALGAAGVHVTGVDTIATVVVTAASDTVAFLGFATSGVPDARDLPAVRRHVARAAALFPRLVVTMHIGAEGRRAQRTRYGIERYAGGGRGNPVAFAHTAIDAGADLVIGHGPHVVRALERRRGRLIAYSLGNLATYGPFALREPMNRGAVLCASLAPNGRAVTATLGATRQRRPGLPEPDPTLRAVALADSLGALDFPRTRARLRSSGTIIVRPGRSR